MEKIDVKDKKILYHLDIDSRQSLNSIGKKVGLTKDIVAYRMQRMQQNGIIKLFRTYITLPLKLPTRIYYVFQNTNPKIKKEIIEYFVNTKETMYVISLEGSYDLMITVSMNNVYRLNLFLEQTQIRYGKYFAKQASSIDLYASWYALSFLIDDKNEKRTIVRGADDKKLKQIFEDSTPVKIDEMDINILRILAGNARIPTTEIAKQLKSTVTIIHHRIKKMIQSGVIGGFGIVTDLSKIGYHFYHVDINLKNYAKRNKILEYIENNPHLYCVEKALGQAADIELEFYLENVQHLHKIMDDLSMKFPDSIKNFNYFSYLEVHKSTYLD